MGFVMLTGCTVHVVDIPCAYHDAHPNAEVNRLAEQFMEAMFVMCTSGLDADACETWNELNE